MPAVKEGAGCGWDGAGLLAEPGGGRRPQLKPIVVPALAYGQAFAGMVLGWNATFLFGTFAFQSRNIAPSQSSTLIIDKWAREHPLFSSMSFCSTFPVSL